MKINGRKAINFSYYKSFVNDRDKALEQILNKYRVKIADQLRLAFNVMAYTYLGHPGPGVEYTIFHVAQNVEKLVHEMRKNVYLMSLSSESEILARLADKKTHTRTSDLRRIIYKDFEAGGSVSQRTAYYLRKINRKLLGLYDLAMVKQEPLTKEEIASAFPKLKPLPKKRALKQIKEADTKKKSNLSTDMVTEEEWSDILDDYLGEYIPTNRGPDVFYSDEKMISSGRFPAGRYEDKTYEWELEQDITHDFVQTVRDGQSDAADQSGITDFVWIAIVDDKTDDCCLWRDTLTTAEIETELKGKRKNDECDAITPPAHFNCRCTLAPATDELPDKPVSNKGDFDEWLNS